MANVSKLWNPSDLQRGREKKKKKKRRNEKGKSKGLFVESVFLTNHCHSQYGSAKMEGAFAEGDFGLDRKCYLCRVMDLMFRSEVLLDLLYQTNHHFPLSYLYLLQLPLVLSSASLSSSIDILSESDSCYGFLLVFFIKAWLYNMHSLLKFSLC